MTQPHTVTRDYVLQGSFHSDAETAEFVRGVIEVVVRAYVTPTTANASALFRLGAEAVAVAAEVEREALLATSDPPAGHRTP